MFNKIISILLIPIFTVFSILQPAIAVAATPTFRAGATYYPLTPQGAVGAIVDVGAMAGRVSPWVGGIVAGYQVYKMVKEFVDDTSAVKQMIINPSDALPSPLPNVTWSNWVQDISGLWHPASVISPSIFWSNWGSTLYNYTRVQDACSEPARILTNVGPPSLYVFDHATFISSGSYNCFVRQISNGSVWHASSTSSTMRCAVGYVLSGSSCLLNAESAVPYPSDGIPTLKVKPDGTGFEVDTRDQDPLPSLPLDSPIISLGSSPSGAPTRISILPRIGGGMELITEEQYQAPDGTTMTYRQRMLLNNLGKALDWSSGNYPGSLLEQTPTTASASPSTLKLDFPTDYNRELTQVAIRDELVLTKDEIAAKGENSDLAAGSVTASQTLRDHYDLHKDVDELDKAISGIGLPSLPIFLFPDITVPACTPLGWTFQGRQITLDICPHVPTIKSISAWILNLLAAAIAFQMVMNFRAMRVRG